MSVENVERQAIALRKLANKAGVVEHEKRITKGANVYTILITNSDGIDEDARIYADDIYYVNRKEYVDWAIKALTVIRSVWCTFSGEGESEWRESVHKEFIKAGITPKNYLDFVCSKNLKDKQYFTHKQKNKNNSSGWDSPEGGDIRFSSYEL